MNGSTGIWKTAGISFNPQLNERNANIEKLASLVEQAAGNGAKLIVTPEMATTGYHYRDREAIRPFVDSVPGATTDVFARICRQYHTYVVLSLPEVDPVTDLFYISAALIGPDGWIGTYRKIHLWECEAHWAVPGDLGMPVFDTAIGRVAIMICMDSLYFETARMAALQGANILAFPTNSSGQSIAYLQARAEENGLFVVSANRSNQECDFNMVGANAVWAPDGAKLAESEIMHYPQDSGRREGQESLADLDQNWAPDQALANDRTPAILYGQISRKQFDNPARRYLQDRRPELYQDLLLHIAPWNFRWNDQSRHIHAALLQYAPPVMPNEPTTIEAICSQISSAIFAANRQELPLDLIVLPELSCTGPLDGLEPAAIRELAEGLDGETVREMCRIACRYHVHLLFGFPETDGQRFYNTVILVNPAGTIEGHYRKTHLTPADRRWASPGDRISVAESAALGRVGLLIGYDAAFPEAAGVLAVQRADLIAIPSAWSGEFSCAMQMNPALFVHPYPDGAVAAWDGIAAAAQAYTLVANYVGTARTAPSATAPYLGRSGIYVPDPVYGSDGSGHQVASGDQEEIRFASFHTVSREGWYNQQTLIASRKPHLYKALIMPSCGKQVSGT